MDKLKQELKDSVEGNSRELYKQVVKSGAGWVRPRAQAAAARYRLKPNIRCLQECTPYHRRLGTAEQAAAGCLRE